MKAEDFWFWIKFVRYKATCSSFTGRNGSEKFLHQFFHWLKYVEYFLNVLTAGLFLMMFGTFLASCYRCCCFTDSFNELTRWSRCKGEDSRCIEKVTQFRFRYLKNSWVSCQSSRYISFEISSTISSSSRGIHLIFITIYSFYRAWKSYKRGPRSVFYNHLWIQ